MAIRETIADDPETLALQALAWTLGEESRASRFLALTGLDPDTLRASAGRAATLDAVLGFLIAHQPDLIACAEAIGVAPERLAAAQERLAA
jgi:hypothetical protein